MIDKIILDLKKGKMYNLLFNEDDATLVINENRLEKNYPIEIYVLNCFRIFSKTENTKSLNASNEMCQSFEKNFLQQTLTKNTIIRNGAYE